jgi:hypothetical protein
LFDDRRALADDFCYTDNLLLSDVGIVKHIDMQNDRVWFATNLRLKSYSHPTVAFVSTSEIARGNGIAECEETRIVTAFFSEALDQQAILFVQQRFLVSTRDFY